MISSIPAAGSTCWAGRAMMTFLLPGQQHTRRWRRHRYLAADGGSNTLTADWATTRSFCRSMSTLDGGDGNDVLIADGSNNILSGGRARHAHCGTGGATRWTARRARLVCIRCRLRINHIADSGTGGNTVQFNFSFAGSGIVLGWVRSSSASLMRRTPHRQLRPQRSVQHLLDRHLHLCRPYALPARSARHRYDITGTLQADFIQGTAMNERINALDGDDTILAGCMIWWMRAPE